MNSSAYARRQAIIKRRPTITPEMMDEARAALFAATPMHYTDRRIVEEPVPGARA